MKIKLGQLYGMHEALALLRNQKLPIKGKYWVGKNFKKVAKEYGEAEESRQAIIEKYCAKDTDGKAIRLFIEDTRFRDKEYKAGDRVPEGFSGKFRYDVTPDPEFVKEYNELMEIEVDLDVTPIPIDFLDGAEIESGDIMDALEGIIEVED